jgi:hypothetical protein
MSSSYELLMNVLRNDSNALTEEELAEISKEAMKAALE